MGVVAADTELSAPQVPHPLLTPRPTSTTSGSSTWRASSWPTTCRPCPCWPTTPLRAGPPPGEMPLPDRPPLQPRLPLRASPLNAELCPGGRPSPEPGLDTAVPRPHTPTEDRGLSPQALRLGPSAPDHPPPPRPPSRAGPLAAPGQAQPSSAPRAVRGQGCPLPSPCRWVRGEHYRYKFSRPGGRHAAEGKWWIRRRLGPYFLPLNLQDLRGYFTSREWPYPEPE